MMSAELVLGCVFLELPLEIFEEILDYLDKLRDILSLALTCKSFCKILIPDHLIYRHIDANLLHTTLWQKFAASPSLGHRVVSLHVHHDLDNRSTLEAVQLVSEAEGMLCSVVRLMRRLETFHWNGGRRPLLKNEIWKALKQYCPRLRGLRVEVQTDERNSMYSSELFQISNLESFHFIHAMGRDSEIPSSRGLFALLTASPNLRVLELANFVIPGGPTPNIDDVLRDICWPHLDTLDLQGFAFHARPFESFLVQHPSITSLRIRDCHTGLIPIGIGLLPNLRKFHGHREQVTLICAAKCPVEILGTVEFNVHDVMWLGSAFVTVHTTLREVRTEGQPIKSDSFARMARVLPDVRILFNTAV
ncbi:hypothetical protein JAAARDRAFT_582685 [Jaapia argillacea MUCL 33604]|uniref:F-box domain-containing protein n=1 Tax=Jaapia argillacea MUCL 33604 TaxID=933084 RepID=A0A067PJ99_9AGAM|nr:hypothetical protein JAAARDRAFT_582685 [Jaapia argillacea MUCL 33604]